jgi:hypothetical protein
MICLLREKFKVNSKDYNTNNVGAGHALGYNSQIEYRNNVPQE